MSRAAHITPRLRPPARLLQLSALGLALFTGTTATEAVEQIRTFTPRPTRWLCPTELVQGDREFGGNGPRVWASADIRIRRRNFGPRRFSFLVVQIVMRARETKPDWSETQGSWTLRLSDSRWRVTEILSDTHSETDVISTGAGFQFLVPGGRNTVSTPPVQAGNLVQRFEIVGDTGGDDISTDNNCSDDTRIRVFFNPITVRCLRCDQ